MNLSDLFGGGSSNSPVLIHRRFTTASTNAIVITSSPAYIKSIHMQRINLAGTTVNTFLKVYNKGTSPNPAVDTPILTEFQYTDYERTQFTLPNGFLSSNGISYVVVKGVSDTDTTATVANEAVITILYTLA